MVTDAGSWKFSNFTPPQIFRDLTPPLSQSPILLGTQNCVLGVLIFLVLSQRAQRSKKFNLARHFQSRSKFLIPLENFNLDGLDCPTKNRAAVGSLLA